MASGVQSKSLELVNGIPTMVAKSYRHENASSTSWVISHPLGLQFCNVEVIDSNDNKVLPDDISYDSSSQITVTFSVATAGVAIVSI